MRREIDKQVVRATGSLILGLGTILALLAIAITFGLLLSTRGRGDLVRGAAAFFDAMVMGSTMMSCGTILGQQRLLTSLDTENLRHAWAGLLIVMVIGGAVAWWALPALVYLAAAVTTLLVLVRRPLIRLTT